MSADLFAEFGSNAASNKPSNQTNTQPNSLIPGLETAEDNDFGDFTSPTESTWQTQPAQQTGHSRGYSQQYDDNVLFDATLENVSNAESDDWGDFETAEPSQTQQPRGPVPAANQAVNPIGGAVQGQSKTPDILSGDLEWMDSLSIQDKKPPVRNQPAKPAPRKNLPPQKKSISLASTKPPEPSKDDSFEDWADFIDGPPSEPSPTQPPKTTTATPKGISNKQPQPPAQTERDTSQAFSKVNQEHVPASQVRPTNIPPPSVLLELFPQLLEQLRQEATQTKKNLQQKEPLDEAASTILCTLKTAARVIAGRTLRWKRDAILSQSMRIGPARSGKPGGMKLSTVNKNEDIKEQQQAVDVITIWRDRSALFSSVVQAAGKRPVPVVAENVRAMTASAAQGAIKASHACALCGLKRDERLPKVDEGVEDSFGEWWTDHWGHTECKDFWGRNMKLLGQR